MIVKTKKGRGFRGVLEYNLNHEKGYLLESNMAGNTPRELAREFGAVRALRPKLGKAVQHTSISAAPGEHLTDDQWREIGRRYLQHMRFDDSQALIIRHTDRDHEHIHIIANRVTNSGGVVDDSRDYARQDELVRQLEQDYGLQQMERVFSKVQLEGERDKYVREHAKKAPTRGELEHSLRTEQPSIKSRLQALLDAAIEDCQDFTSFARRLEADGVQMVPTVQQGGAKLTGTLYVLDGEKMKGGDLGKAYTAAGIQKRGIEYEQNRDLETVRRCRERAGLDREGARPSAGSPDLAGAGEGAQHGAPIDSRRTGAAHRADVGNNGRAGADGYDPVGDGIRSDRQGSGSGKTAFQWIVERLEQSRGGIGDLPRDAHAAMGLGGVSVPNVGTDRGGATRRISGMGRWAEAVARDAGIQRHRGAANAAPVRDSAGDTPAPAAPVKKEKKDVRAFLDDFWSSEKRQQRAAEEQQARARVEQEQRRQEAEEAKRKAEEAERERQREWERQQQEWRRQHMPQPRPAPQRRPAPRRDTPSRGRSGPSL